MAIQLEPKEKRWLKRVYFYLLNANKPSANNWDVTTFNDVAKGNMQLDTKVADVDAAWNCVQKINEVIINREYSDITDEIMDLSKAARYWDKDKEDYLVLSAPEIADALAGMCVLNGFVWDPADYTQFEIAQFDKTLFGKALKMAWEMQNKNSEEEKQVPPTPSSSAQAPDPSSSVPTAGNYIDGKASVHRKTVQKKDPTVTKNDYKQSGPQSPNCFDLKSQPFQKEKLSGENGNVFVIVAEDSTTSANKPYAFINPLINTPNYRTNNTNKIKFGSGHAYSDLPLYFNTLADGQAFLSKMISANLIPSRFTNPHVGKQAFTGIMRKFLSHDFYRIGTELGDVYVCAYKLNEDLEESILESQEFDEAAWKEEMKKVQAEKPWK